VNQILGGQNENEGLHIIVSITPPETGKKREKGPVLTYNLNPFFFSHTVILTYLPRRINLKNGKF